MATFGLIPGAWHGAWCFERLTAALEQRGHDAIAVELPCDDAAAGFPEYVAADHTMWWSDQDGAIAAMYADCDPVDTRLAASRLRRQATTPHRVINDAIPMPPFPT